MEIFVSVIMSTHNREKYLVESIESILSQSYERFEFLIINDSSSDNTEEVLNSIADPRVRIFHNTENRGLTRNLNTLLFEARGKYIVRMDDDDISHHHRIEKLVNAASINSSDIVCSNIEYIGLNQELICVRQNPSLDDELKKLPEVNPIAHVSVLYDREKVLEVGGYNEEYMSGQDGELWARSRDHGLKFFYIDEPLVKVRINMDSVTSRRLGYTDSKYVYSKICLINGSRSQFFLFWFQVKSIKQRIVLLMRLVLGEKTIGLLKLTKRKNYNLAHKKKL